MSSHAPAEIWEIILEYAIEVPLFLDSNPLESYDIDILDQYSYQNPYWQAERDRNSFRRVCSAWDTYLKTHTHRFIRVEDVIRERVPVTALPSAIRIDLNMHCRCRKCNYEDLMDQFMERMVATWTTAVQGQSEQSEKAVWKLEILDGWLDKRSEYISTLKRIAPRLRVMLAQPGSTLTSKEDALENLTILTPAAKGRRPFINTVGLTSLTVLHASIEALGPPLDKNELPSLRHLTIDLYSRRDPTQEDVRTFLQSIGPQLETFYYVQSLIRLKIEPEMWNVLPEVKKIQLPYTWNDCELPPQHPLQHVQVAIEEFGATIS